MVSEEYVTIILTKEWKKNPEEHAVCMYCKSGKRTTRSMVR
jgi:hypothetical protein